MNMQAMLKQAQKIQKEMMQAKEEIDAKVFVGKSSLVSAEVSGDKKILKVKINSENLEKDDIEMVEDMIVVALNDALTQIDQETEEKMGKYTQGMPGLF